MSSQRLGSVDSVTIRNLNTERTEDLRDLSVEALEARRSQRGRAATKKRRKNLCKAQTFSRLVVQRTSIACGPRSHYGRYSRAQSDVSLSLDPAVRNPNQNIGI